MAELTPVDRIQPSLLDRLIDESPHEKQEGRGKRVMSSREYRKAVLRDLQWLLNANAHPPEDGLEDFPEAARSVINFGMPELAGRTSSALGAEVLERMVRAAIRNYEPRILANSLAVRGVESEDVSGGGNVIAMEIRGDLWASPLPEHLYLKTQLDLETGTCEVHEQG